MDRPKHHWFIFLGLALVSCGVVLLGLQWMQPKADDGKPSSVTTLKSPERSPEPAQSQPAAAIVLGPDERRENVFVTATESPGRTVRGSVKGLPSDALERTFVTLQSDSRGPVAMPLEKDGTFVLRGVPPGRARIGFNIDSGNRTLVKAIEVPAHKDLLVDIEFPAGMRVSGRVTQGGKPRTADGGTYRVDDVPAGEYQITAQGGAARRIAITDDAVIDIDVPATQLGGRVLEKDGSVLAGLPENPDVRLKSTHKKRLILLK